MHYSVAYSYVTMLLLINHDFSERILISGFYSSAVARSLPNVDSTIYILAPTLPVNWTGTVAGYLLGAAAVSGAVAAAGWFCGCSSDNSSSCRRMVVVAVLYGCGGRVVLIILSDGKFRFC